MDVATNPDSWSRYKDMFILHTKQLNTVKHAIYWSYGYWDYNYKS